MRGMNAVWNKSTTSVFLRVHLVANVLSNYAPYVLNVLRFNSLEFFPYCISNWLFLQV